MQYASGASVLFACTVFALLIGKHWSWPPFAVGPLIAAAALGLNAIIVRRTVAAFEPSREQLDRLASRRRAGNKVLVPVLVAMGIGFGLVAGSIPSYWPDALFGLLMISTSVIGPLLLLPMIKRRYAAQRQSAPMSD